MGSTALAFAAAVARGATAVQNSSITYGVAAVIALAPVVVAAHTNALGYIIGAGSAAGLFNVEIVYGSWHGGTIAPEGDLALSQDGTLIGTQTFTSLLGPVANGVVPDGLIPGTNYFFADGASLSPVNNGQGVFNFQSVTFLDLTPGTFTFGYATTSGLSVNWEPSGSAIQNGSFVLTAGGGVVVPGITPNIDTTEGSYASSGLGTDVNPVFEGGTLAIDEAGSSYSNDFTLDASASNTIDSLGNSTTLTGTFANAAGAAGTISFIDSVGGGTVTLEGANTHTGGTTLNSGTLALAGAGTLGAATGSTAVNGGTLDLGTTAQTQATLSQAGGVVTNGLIAVTDYVLTGGLLDASATVSAENEFALSGGGVAGTLTGTGAVVKDGAGSVVLAGANDFTGGTTVNAGVLAVTGAGTLGSATGATVVNGGALDLGTTSQTQSTLTQNGGVVANGTAIVDTYTLNGGALAGSATVNASSSFNVSEGAIAGALTGSGELSKSGAGTVVLAGLNDYTGGTAITAGTLQIGAGGTSGSIVGNVANDGVLAFNRADAIVFGGDISGSGALVQAGSGTTVLAGNNTYTGGTLINAGTVVGSVGSFGSGPIVNDSALVFQQDANATFGNLLAGSGVLTKAGQGVLEVAGDSSAFTGVTNVAAGSLLVSGSLANSAVNVGSGASLGGAGVVGSTTLLAGSTISPGSATLGGLTVNGSFVQGAGAVYQAQINPVTGASDVIIVSGAAALEAGAVLNVSQVSRAINPVGTRFTVLSAGSLAGTYTLVGDTNLTAFLSLVDTYDGANAYLEVAQTRSFVDVAATANQRGVASALQTLPTASPVFAAVALSLTQEEAQFAYDQLSGEVHASLLGSLANDSRFARNAALARLRSADCRADVADPNTSSSSSSTSGCEDEKVTAWGSAFGSWGDRDGNGNASSVDRSTGGFFVGMDTPLDPTWRVGLLTGYSQSTTDVDYLRSKAESDDYHIGAYSSGSWGDLNVRFGAIYTHHEISTSRQVAFGSFSETVSADYSANTAQTFAEISYQVAFAQAKLEPFAQIAYANVDTNGFRETGGFSALQDGDTSFDSTFTTLGLRATGLYTVNGLVVRPNGIIGWRHSFQSDLSTTLSYADSASFGVDGTPIAADALVVEAGFDVDVAPNAALGLSYTGQYGDGEVDQGVRADFKYRF